MAVFLDVAPCSLVEIDQFLISVCCLLHEGDECPGDEGSKHF
jgi:hypothetical protein